MKKVIKKALKEAAIFLIKAVTGAVIAEIIHMIFSQPHSLKGAGSLGFSTLLPVSLLYFKGAEMSIKRIIRVLVEVIAIGVAAFLILKLCGVW